MKKGLMIMAFSLLSSFPAFALGTGDIGSVVPPAGAVNQLALEILLERNPVVQCKGLKKQKLSQIVAMSIMSPVGDALGPVSFHICEEISGPVHQCKLGLNNTKSVTREENGRVFIDHVASEIRISYQFDETSSTRPKISAIECSLSQ